MKIYSLTGFPSALTGSFTGSFFGDGSGLTGTDSGSWDGDFVGPAKITGSLSLSGSFKDQESSSGTAGQVLSSTVSGSQWVDVGGTGIGDVTKTGTITANQIAIWNNTTNQLRSDPTFVIDSNNKIILYQPKISGGAADISTSNIGGGNLANVTGAGNTGFGKNNLNSLTQGFSNNAFGEDALLSLTTGTFNVAVGSLALKTNLIGGSNTAIGNSAYRSGTGSNNTSIGAQSLFGATTGGDNVAVGYKAIAVGTGISFATAVGTSAIEYNIGNGNTAIGYHALRGPSSGTVNGNSNTAVGNGSLKNLTTSTNSTALGESSGQNVTTGGGNTLIGTNAGSTMTTNSGNTFVGVNAGNGLNSTSAFNGNGNTFIGNYAGSSTTTATDCVIIGSNNGSTIAALSNNIIISDGDGNNRLQFGSTGAATFSGDIIRKGNVGNISFEGGSVTNINAQIQYDQVNNTTGQLFFKTANSGTLATRLTISSAGVATFSGDIIVSKSGDAGINLNSTTTNGVAVTRYGTTATGNLWATGINITNSDSRWEIYNFGLASSPLIISSTGAATFNSSIANFGASITNNNDSSQGLLVRTSDNDGDEYILDLQSSSSSTGTDYASKFKVAKGGTATFTGLINANQGVAVVDTTAGSAGTPQFKTLLSYQYSNVNALSTIKGGNEASGTNGTYLKFSVNSSAAVNTPIDILTLKSAFVGGTTAQFDALIKANNGISFPNQSAGSGTVSSSTLDAYEEGTWTAIPQRITTAITGTIVTSCNYVKIGKLVYYNIDIDIQAITAQGTNICTIGGLPFTVSTSQSRYSNQAIFDKSAQTAVTGMVTGNVGTYVDYAYNSIIVSQAGGSWQVGRIALSGMYIST